MAATTTGSRFTTRRARSWIYDPNDETKANCVKFGLDKMQGDRSVVLHFNIDGPIIDKI